MEVKEGAGAVRAQQGGSGEETEWVER